MKQRPVPGRLIPLMSGLYLLLFLLSDLIGQTESAALPVVFSFVSDFLLSLFALILSTALLLRMKEKPVHTLIPGICLFSLPEFFYLTPNYYLYFLQGGLNTAEAIPMAAVVALLQSVLLGGVIRLLMLPVVRKYFFAFGRAVGIPFYKSVPEKVLDGNHPWFIGILLMGLPEAVLRLGKEVYDIVIFLVSSFDSVSAGEVLYMTFSILFVPLSLFAAVVLCACLCRRCLSETEPTAEAPHSDE